MPFYPPYADQDGPPQGPGLDEYLGTEAEKAQQEYNDDKSVDLAAEQAQQEADHRRDVEQDRQMVTDDPEPPRPVIVESNWPKAPPNGLGLPYIHGVAHLRVLNYNYWNANGKGICIAAVEGYVSDWAAYIGADDGQRTEECVEWTIRRGCKLSRLQAHRWFPDLPIEAYRE